MKRTLAVLAVGTMLPLCAHEGVRFGTELSTVAPVGAFHHVAKQGVKLGGFVTYDICKGQTVAVKMSVGQFGKIKTPNVKGVPPKAPEVKAEVVAQLVGARPMQNVSTTTVGLGADYMFSINKEGDSGLFFLAGVGGEHNRVNRKLVKAEKVQKLEEKENKKKVKKDVGMAAEQVVARDVKQGKEDVNSLADFDIYAGETNAGAKSMHISHNDFTYSVGCGYKFDKNLAVQTRYDAHRRSGHTYPAVNVGVSYTF